MYLEKITSSQQPDPDRRQSPRFHVRCRARINIASRHYAGYVDNIAEGGAKLRTLSPIGRIGEVVVRLPDLGSLRAKLCWTDRYNAGVRFDVPLTARQLMIWLENRSSASLRDETGARQTIEIDFAQDSSLGVQG